MVYTPLQSLALLFSMESYFLWKFFALSFVVVLILGGCESDQTTTNSGRVSPRLNKSVDTAPTVVSVKVVSDFQLTATANAKYNASRNSLPKSDISGNSATASAKAEAQRGADRNRNEVPSCFPNCPTQVPTVIQLPPATAAPTSDPSPTIQVRTPQPTMTPTQYLIGLATFFRSNWILDSDHAVRVSSHLESLNPPREYLQDHKRLLDVHQLWLYQFMQVEFFDESSALTYGATSDAVVSCANATDPYAHVDYTIEYKAACNHLSKLRNFVWDEEWFWKDSDAYKQVEEYAQIIR
ncbi:hypothetical protein [Candidatus Lucifugimonas marina]|uniref:Uncharacterized protein n=1 Tax=Candidatus Lucifugimonas marina TaxID=3038979 RepID=A0AAJ6CU11_9CHLR|nr:hypothetical protein [SAR202 cluster bacterium JH639]WFG38704.1 hypothetical protein GKO48_03485 [SAR202 cluster bacterium JH1073]